jgi:hydroxyethylthiazole kinase
VSSYHLNKLKEKISSLLKEVRNRRPVVHAITNWVTGGEVANALQALGARPVLALSTVEAAEITARADALYLNLGTPTPDRIEAMLSSGRRANEIGLPVILDPVGAGASHFREEACRQILSELNLTILRGNRAEIGALAGQGGQLRGIDAVSGPDDIHEALRVLSGRRGAVVVASGEKDHIFYDGKMVLVGNGHPLMLRVTGTGCMLSAVIAAFAAVGPDPLEAAIAGVSCFKLAGELAGRNAGGPGAFKTGLMDFLYALTPDDLQRSADIQG